MQRAVVSVRKNELIVNQMFITRGLTVFLNILNKSKSYISIGPVNTKKITLKLLSVIFLSNENANMHRMNFLLF